MTETSHINSQAKRNVGVLIGAQVVLGSQLPIHMVLAGLVGQMLAPNPCLATMPVSVMMLGSMISSPLLASLMQLHGRRFGFFLGATAGALAAILSGLGIYLGSFALFTFASVFFGTYISTQSFYRFAATDLASDDFRPRAISYVLAGGLLPALIGPQLLKLTQDAIPLFPFLGAYILIFALNAFGSLVFIGLIDTQHKEAPTGSGERVRSYGQLLRTPAILVSMIVAMVSYSLMTLVMTSTPLAVVGCGFETGDAADVVSAHVFAMFAPSFVTGALIARFGTGRIMATGLIILAAAGGVALAGIELSNFFIALVLLGIGWNFGFIAATNLLAASHNPAERGRVQGMNDFLVFSMVTIASFASGGLMNCSGSTAHEGWNAVNYAMAPFLTLAGGALIWFWLDRRVKTN